MVLKEHGARAHSIMPPGLPGYNSKATTVVGVRSGEGEAVAAESKLRRSSGLPKITLSQVGAGATAGDDIQAMVEMWKQNLGVEVEIQQTDQATFWQDLDKRSYQIFAAGWVMDYPDPEDILDILFNSKSNQNSTGDSNSAGRPVARAGPHRAGLDETHGPLSADRATNSGRRAVGTALLRA